MHKGECHASYIENQSEVVVVVVVVVDLIFMLLRVVPVCQHQRFPQQ